MRYIFFISLIIIGFAAKAQPAFKGGEPALNDFLNQHIVYPDFARKNCIAATIQVSFRVNKSGGVDQVKVLNGPGIDLDEEAVRVIKMTAGKWVLANGTQAITFVLPVRFVPDYARCNTSVHMDMNQAINAYRARQALEDAITNYYENKYAGKADTTKQAYIDDLKQQLGFNDDLITDVLQQADDKLKQGDKEGACTSWKFIRNIGSDRADKFIAQYCK